MHKRGSLRLSESPPGHPLPQLPKPLRVNKLPILGVKTIFAFFLPATHFLIKPWVRVIGMKTWVSKFLRTRSIGISGTGPASPMPALFQSASMFQLCAGAMPQESSNHESGRHSPDEGHAFIDTKERCWNTGVELSQVAAVLPRFPRRFGHIPVSECALRPISAHHRRQAIVRR